MSAPAQVTPSGTTTSRTASLWRAAGVTGAAVAVAGLLGTVDPNRPGHYPTCPFLFVTGAYCPGCGSLRAIHDLVHLDPVGALARNPLTVVLLPYLVFAWACWLLRLSGRRAPHPTAIPPVFVWGLLVVVLGFWVLRNVPGWTWLSPA